MHHTIGLNQHRFSLSLARPNSQPPLGPPIPSTLESTGLCCPVNQCYTLGVTKLPSIPGILLTTAPLTPDYVVSPDSVSYWGSYFKYRKSCVCAFSSLAAGCRWCVRCWCRCRVPLLCALVSLGAEANIRRKEKPTSVGRK